MQRLGKAKLDWLVVRDMVMIESATWWKDSPEIETGELRPGDIGTEVFFLPAAAHTEKAGSFTNTQRLLQWHHQAVEPDPGQAGRLRRRGGPAGARPDLGLPDAGEVLTSAGLAGAVLAGRSRAAAALSGAALMAASALTRFGVFEAGRASARNPKYTVGPQRQRLREQASRPADRFRPRTARLH